MSDTIFIHQLKTAAIIGIHDWEKQQTQPLLLDLELSFDCRQAAQSDDINDALDYFEVSHQVKELVEASRFELIETLAETVCTYVLEHFPCQQITLTLYKPEAVPDAESVGVRITRTA